MKRVYTSPAFVVEQFEANQCIAGCDWSIVSGKDAVRVYCVKTSYITVFTSAIGCTYKRNAFTSTAEAEAFFSHMFQWGDDVSEDSNDNKDYTYKWTTEQRKAANAEIEDGFKKYTANTILVGKNSSGRTHAGYALDYINGLEGKALS